MIALIIASVVLVVALAVLAYVWWKTRPVKVYDHTPEAGNIPVEPFDHGGLV